MGGEGICNYGQTIRNSNARMVIIKNIYRYWKLNITPKCGTYTLLTVRCNVIFVPYLEVTFVLLDDGTNLKPTT
jgi:hypothetical protein